MHYVSARFTNGSDMSADGPFRDGRRAGEESPSSTGGPWITRNRLAQVGTEQLILVNANTVIQSFVAKEFGFPPIAGSLIKSIGPVNDLIFPTGFTFLRKRRPGGIAHP